MGFFDSFKKMIKDICETPAQKERKKIEHLTEQELAFFIKYPQEMKSKGYGYSAVRDLWMERHFGKELIEYAKFDLMISIKYFGTDAKNNPLIEYIDEYVKRGNTRALDPATISFIYNNLILESNYSIGDLKIYKFPFDERVMGRGQTAKKEILQALVFVENPLKSINASLPDDIYEQFFSGNDLKSYIEINELLNSYGLNLEGYN